MVKSYRGQPVEICCPIKSCQLPMRAVVPQVRASIIREPETRPALRSCAVEKRFVLGNERVDFGMLVPANSDVVLKRSAKRSAENRPSLQAVDLVGGPGRTRTCNQTVMSGAPCRESLVLSGFFVGDHPS